MALRDRLGIPAPPGEAATMARLQARCEAAQTRQQSGAVAAQLAHNQTVGGATPPSATNLENQTKAPPVSGEAIDRSANVAPASAEVRQTPPPLEWVDRVRGTNFQHDQTGEYTVSASRVAGVYVYSAYFGRNPGKVLGVAQSSAQAAREIAEAHARGRV